MTNIFVEQLAYSIFECGIQLADGTIINKRIVPAFDEDTAREVYKKLYKIKVFTEDKEF
jgi:hypothetical protein